MAKVVLAMKKSTGATTSKQATNATKAMKGKNAKKMSTTAMKGKNVTKMVVKGKAKKIKRMTPIRKTKVGAEKSTAATWPPTYRQVQRMIRNPTVDDVMRRLERTPARVGVSSIDGVGLIAIRPIKKGEKMYEGMQKLYHDEFGDKIVPVPESAIAAMEKKPGLAAVGVMVRAYTASCKDENFGGEEIFGMPWRALDSLCPMWFINDGGANHNVKYLDGDEEDGIVAVRDIEPGEELLSNFEFLGEGMDNEVKQYPDDAAWAEAKARADEIRKEVIAVQKRLADAEAEVTVASRAAAQSQKTN